MSKAKAPNWSKLVTGDTTILGDYRSCANCAHKNDATHPKDPGLWKCVRTGSYCDLSVRRDTICGVNLKLWTPAPPVKPSFWRRLLNKVSRE